MSIFHNQLLTFVSKQGIIKKDFRRSSFKFKFKTGVKMQVQRRKLLRQTKKQRKDGRKNFSAREGLLTRISKGSEILITGQGETSPFLKGVVTTIERCINCPVPTRVAFNILECYEDPNLKKTAAEIVLLKNKGKPFYQLNGVNVAFNKFHLIDAEDVAA